MVEAICAFNYTAVLSVLASVLVVAGIATVGAYFLLRAILAARRAALLGDWRRMLWIVYMMLACAYAGGAVYMAVRWIIDYHRKAHCARRRTAVRRLAR